MPMLSAIKIMNNIESGTLNGSSLETLLANNAGKLAEFTLMLNTRSQAKRVSVTQTSMNAITSSATAMNALINNPVGLNYFFASPYYVGKGLNTLLVNGGGSSNSTLNGLNDFTSIVINPTAITAAGSSLKAMTAITNSSKAKTILANYLPIATNIGAGYYSGIINNNIIIMAPFSTGESNSKQWKTENTITANTTSLTDGWSNTLAMISGGSALHPAANFCRGLSIGSYTDWYFPAKDELNLLWVNKTVLNTADTTGDLSATNYWSSSESSSTNGWCQGLGDGGQSNATKTSNYYVRAVRRIQL